jgi:hypothetical protein
MILCPADLGYAAITTVNLSVQSYRKGNAYVFDKNSGKVSQVDETWTQRPDSWFRALTPRECFQGSA